MKFIEEKALRDAFWSQYKKNPHILTYQFECNARHGGVDLLTVEEFKPNRSDKTIIQFVSFEFKLDDIEKAISQAAANLEFTHKAFIVVPEYKQKVIQDKYMNTLARLRYVGVMTVSMTPRYYMPVRCWAQSDKEVRLNQEILKMMTECKKSVL